MPTSPTSITALPPAPQRKDSPSTFIDKADDHVAALTPWTDDVNEIADNVFDNATESETTATASAGSASGSQTSAVASENSADAAASSANFVGLWSDQTGAANIPYSVFHEGLNWNLVNNLADVTASEPSTANTDWELSTTIPDEIEAAAAIFAYNNF